MDASSYQQAAALFKALVDEPEAVVQARLALIDDPALRRLVRSWLAADAEPSGWMGSDRGLRLSLGESTRAPETLEPGTKIGSFTVMHALGAGGMGTVYVARQHKPARDVAFKVLHSWQRVAAVLDRFQFEAEALARLAHPSIPQVYASGDDDGVAWIAMERVHGQTLQDWVTCTGLTVRRRLRLALDIVHAVGCAHDAGLVHRDLKPDNVLVAAGSLPKVLDFGVSVGVDEAASVRSVRFGTPAWTSPEQRVGEPATQRSDVWSLGVLVWHLVVGASPFPHRDAPPRFDAGGLTLPPDLRAVVRKAVSDDPADRYANASAMADDLAAAMSEQKVRAVSWSAKYALQVWFRRHRTVGRTAAALALVGLGVVGVMSFNAYTVGQQREVQAQAALRAAVPRVEPSDAKARADVAARLEAYVSTPKYAHTASISEAWRQVARYATDADAQLDALARAYTEAHGFEGQRAALRDVVRTLHQRWRWTEAATAERMLNSMGDEIDVDASVAVRLGAGDVQGALDRLGAGDARRPLLEAVRGVTPLPVRGGGLRVDGRLMVVDTERAITELSVAPELRVLRRWDVRDLEVGWPRTHLVEQDGLWLFAAQRGLSRLTDVWALDDKGLHAQGSLPDTSVLRVAPMSVGDRQSVLVGTGPYKRRLLEAQRVGGQWSSRALDVDLNSMGADIQHVVVGQLDADPEPEVVVAQGPWSTYGVVRLDAEPDGSLVQGEDLLLGYVNDVAWLSTPNGPRVLALKSDRYASPQIFGPEQPYGMPPGLYLLEPTDRGLAVVSHLVLSVPPGDEHLMGYVHAYTGDLDGDAFTDVVVHVDRGSEQLTWLLRQDGEGAFVDVLLPGYMPSGLVDLDGDGTDEVLASLQRDLMSGVVLGLGEAAGVAAADAVQPETDAFAELRVADPVPYERAQVLVDLGMPMRAASHLAERAAAAPAGEAAAMYYRAASVASEAHDFSRARAYLDAATARLDHVAAPAERMVRQVAQARYEAAHRTARVDVALEAAQTLAALDPGWADEAARLTRASEVPVYTWGQDGEDWSHGAHIVTPGSVRALSSSALRVDVPNSGEASLAIDLREPGPRVGLSASFRVTRLEASSVPAVALESLGKRVIGSDVYLDSQQNQGAEVGCWRWDPHGLDVTPSLPAPPVPFDVTVRVEWLDGVERCELTVGEQTVVGHRAFDRPLEHLDRLTVGDGGKGDYAGGSSTLSTLELRQLSVWGVKPANDVSPADPSWKVARGERIDCADAAVSPALCLHSELQNGALSAAATLIRTLADDPSQHTTLKQALRFHAPYAHAAFSEALSPDAYAVRVAQSWMGTFLHAPAQQVLTELDLAVFNDVSITDDDVADLILKRADALAEVGSWQRALADVERVDAPVVRELLPLALRVQARTLHAKVLAQLERWDEAQVMADALLAESPFPGATQRAMMRHPLLSKLVDAQAISREPTPIVRRSMPQP